MTIYGLVTGQQVDLDEMQRSQSRGWWLPDPGSSLEGKAAQSQSRVPITEWERKGAARPATKHKGWEVLATEKKQRLLERKSGCH